MCASGARQEGALAPNGARSGSKRTCRVLSLGKELRHAFSCKRGRTGGGKPTTSRALVRSAVPQQPGETGKGEAVHQAAPREQSVLGVPLSRGVGPQPHPAPESPRRGTERLEQRLPRRQRAALRGERLRGQISGEGIRYELCLPPPWPRRGLARLRAIGAAQHGKLELGRPLLGLSSSVRCRACSLCVATAAALRAARASIVPVLGPDVETSRAGAMPALLACCRSPIDGGQP